MKTALAGPLTYMKITHAEIYPRSALSPHFSLGEVQVTGLPNQFSLGIMLLGGSLTTNMISWLLAPIILLGSLRNRLKIAMKILGIFGVLDLPFYALFPQLGPQTLDHHWGLST